VSTSPSGYVTAFGEAGVPKGYKALEHFFVSARTIKRHHHHHPWVGRRGRVQSPSDF
jgi:hypothetical protein